MSIKIGKIFETVLNEAKNDALIKALFEPLTIEDGNIKLWHYSGNLIEDDYVSTGGPQGTHSKSEFRAWGKSRSFFYGIEGGPAHDSGVPTRFKYICHIPMKYVYPVMINPNKYEVPSGQHYWQSMYEQATADGYKAFIYNLGGKAGVPIIVAFVDIPIDEKFGPASGGGYRNLAEKEVDYPIGTFEEGGETWTIMQQDGYIKSLNNTYLTQEEDPEEAMTSYKKPFHVYQWKGANLFPEYESDYLMDLKNT